MIDVVEILRQGAFDASIAADEIVLDHDHRLRRRIVLTTAGGRAVRLAEARTVQLREGDGLRLADGSVVRVKAADEPVADVTASSPAALVRIAWHLGNRHLPTQLIGEVLRIRQDHVIEAMITGLGGWCVRREAPFDPEAGAYAEQGLAHAPGRHHHHGDGHGRHHHGHGA